MIIIIDKLISLSLKGTVKKEISREDVSVKKKRNVRRDLHVKLDVWDSGVFNCCLVFSAAQSYNDYWYLQVNRDKIINLLNPLIC